MNRLNNGHYEFDSVEYMTTWAYKMKYGGSTSTASNAADTQSIHRDYERTGLHCLSEYGPPIEIDLHRVSNLQKFYGQREKFGFGSGRNSGNKRTFISNDAPETVGESIPNPGEPFHGY